MLTVIIDAQTEAERLPGLLAQLTAGAVDGLVRQVAIVATSSHANIADLCEETGAEPHLTIKSAAEAARADWIVAVPADFRLRDGWIGALKDHLERGQGRAVIRGLSDHGLFAPRLYGVLVERGRLTRGHHADLKSLRRALGFNPRRTG